MTETTSDWTETTQIFERVYGFVKGCFNDKQTRDEALAYVMMFCEDNNIKTICDDSNNPPELIDSFGFAMTFIKDDGSARTYTAKPSKISFDEIEKELEKVG